MIWPLLKILLPCLSHTISACISFSHLLSHLITFPLLFPAAPILHCHSNLSWGGLSWAVTKSCFCILVRGNDSNSQMSLAKSSYFCVLPSLLGGTTSYSKKTHPNEVRSPLQVCLFVPMYVPESWISYSSRQHEYYILDSALSKQGDKQTLSLSFAFNKVWFGFPPKKQIDLEYSLRGKAPHVPLRLYLSVSKCCHLCWWKERSVLHYQAKDKEQNGRNMCITLYEQLHILHDEDPYVLVQPLHLLHDNGFEDACK